MNDYRTIPLTHGQVAIVDAGDYEMLSLHKWKATRSRRGFYATRQVYVEKKYHTISMHRQILGLGEKDKRQGDHANHDTLDNRRSNLRIATASQNQCNRHRPRNNSSGFKGVAWHKASEKWRAYIQVRGETHYLGYFCTPELAHAAYREAANLLHDSFAQVW
jgi:hypothetical protein